MTKLKEPARTSKISVNWRLWFGLLGAITSLVIICYADTLTMGTVFNDDLTLHFFDSGPQAANNALDMLFSPLTQPWVRQSYMLDLANYTNPDSHMTAFGWFHLVDAYWHWVSCAALFCLTFRLFWRWKNEGQVSCDPYRIAFVCALLFACHPMAAQSATYLSARYSVLSACNYLLALNCFLLGLLSHPGSGKVWGYILFVLFAWLTLCSGTVGLTLLPVVIVLFFLVKPGSTSWKEWALEHPVSLGLLIAFCVTVPFTFLLGFQPAAAADNYGMAPVSTAAYYATQAKAFVSYYLRCAVVPLGLSVDPPFARASSFTDPLAILGLVCFAAGVGSIYFVRRHKAIVLGLCLMLLGFLPHAAIRQVELVADPAFYLSLAGFSLVVAVLLDRVLGQRWQQALEKLAPLAIVLCALSIMHNLDFRNDQTLVDGTLKVNKDSVVAYSLSASNAFTDGHYDKAIADADKALALQPNAMVPALAKGTALLKLRRYAEAEAPLSKALELAQRQHLPVASGAAYALAESYLRQGKGDRISALVQKAIMTDPKNARVFFVLGVMEAQKHDDQHALAYLKKAFDAGVLDALPPLADVLLRENRTKDALHVAEMALKYAKTLDARIAYANCAIVANQLDAAESTLKEAADIYKNDPTVVALQSLVSERKGEADAARRYKEAALKLNPNAFADVVVPESNQAADSEKKERRK